MRDSGMIRPWFNIRFNMIYDYVIVYDSDFTHISCKPMLLPMFFPRFYYYPVIFLTSHHTKNRSPLSQAAWDQWTAPSPPASPGFLGSRRIQGIQVTSAGEKKTKNRAIAKKWHMYDGYKITPNYYQKFYLYMKSGNYPNTVYTVIIYICVCVLKKSELIT